MPAASDATQARRPSLGSSLGSLLLLLALTAVGVAVVLKLFAVAEAPATAPLRLPTLSIRICLAPEGPEIGARKTRKPMGARGANRADALGQARVGAIEPKAGGDVVPQDKPQEHHHGAEFI